MKIGDRARFTAKDKQFHYGEREGKVGTILGDANLDAVAMPPNFGGGTCMWQIDGDDGVYITALEDLTLETEARK
jgi:hypothetical protein